MLPCFGGGADLGCPVCRAHSGLSDRWILCTLRVTSNRPFSTLGVVEPVCLILSGWRSIAAAVRPFSRLSGNDPYGVLGWEPSGVVRVVSTCLQSAELLEICGGQIEKPHIKKTWGSATGPGALTAVMAACGELPISRHPESGERAILRLMAHGAHITIGAYGQSSVCCSGRAARSFCCGLLRLPAAYRYIPIL